MGLTAETITATRDFALTPAQLFAHWTSPQTRVRWETGPGTGMRYDAFDTRPGGVEIVRVAPEGTEIGHMVQRIHQAIPGARLTSTIEGHFGGAVTLLIAVAIDFSATDRGSRLHATAQVMDLTGRDVRSDHEQGWAWLLGRFADDIATHGPIAP